MAICDECCCYDDNHIDGEDITEEELERISTMNQIGITIGMVIFKRTIKCQLVMIAYVRNVLETFSIVERYLKNILTMVISILHGMMRNMVGLYQFKKWHNRGDIPPQCAL